MSDLLNQASLVMVPSGYKEDTVYSVVPSDGSGDLSFTRASNGTRVNSAGLVEVCPWNLAEQSNAFNTSPWSIGSVAGTNPIITANYGIAPDGTLTAQRIQLARTNTTTSYSQIYQYPIAVVIGQTYTWSVWLKSLSGTPTISIIGDFGRPPVTLTSEWVRYTGTGTASSGLTQLEIAILGSNYATGNSLSADFLAYGYQINIGSTAKPYFPTTDRLNVPRLTYQNGGGGCPSLLLEKQSTNVILYSEQFDDASWTKNVSVTANAIISPDGTQNADKILESASNVQQWAYQSPSMTGAQTATIYAKKGERNYIAMATAGLDPSYFNLDTGVVVSTASGATASITSVGNGWYRCSVSSASIVGGTFYIVWISYDGVNRSYAGDTSKGIYVWGAQNEASSYPTSYIPTTSSSATRVADACFKNGITSLIGQSEGTLFAEFIFNSATFPTMVMFLTTNSSFANAVYIQTFSSDGLSFQVWSGVVNQVSINTTGLTNGQKVKVAVGYKANDFVIYINGVQKGTDTSGSLPASLNNLEIGTYLEGGSPYTYAQSINQAAVFKTRLTNAELASLTTI